MSDPTQTPSYGWDDIEKSMTVHYLGHKEVLRGPYRNREEAMKAGLAYAKSMGWKDERCSDLSSMY